MARTERIAAGTLAEELAGESPPVVVDVRAEREWKEGSIEGSLNIPLNQLPRKTGDFDAGLHVVVHCASGYRSSVAASVLNRAREDLRVSDLVGGIDAWEAAKLPVSGPNKES